MYWSAQVLTIAFLVKFYSDDRAFDVSCGLNVSIVSSVDRANRVGVLLRRHLV